MNTYLETNIARIIEFFSNKGFTVSIEKIPEAFQTEHFNHVISLDKYSDDMIQIQSFLNLLIKVWPFPGPEQCRKGNYRFLIPVDEDFIICRECGCSEKNPCHEVCSWVEEDLCSSCINEEELKVN